MFVTLSSTQGLYHFLHSAYRDEKEGSVMHTIHVHLFVHAIYINITTIFVIYWE